MRRTILLVDDNAIQAMTRRVILENAGHVVALAENGKLALERYTTALHTTPFSLIITDHLMPEMNGPELVRALRGRGVTLPIVVLSGLPEAEAEYAGMDVAFRLKPLAPPELLALVNAAAGSPPMASVA